MKYFRIVLVLGIWNLGFSPALKAQATPQQQARQAEQASKGPLLFAYDSTYLDTEAAERVEFLRKKVLIDSMDISQNYREKLLRDLYKAKPTKRLTKALLAATIYEEDDLSGDPEQDR